MQVVVDSLLVEYDRAGRQPRRKKIVILHGWADSSLGWRDTLQHFSARYDVTVVDLPGFGKSQMPPRAWGLGDYAAFVGTFLAKISVKPDIIIAHSNGGAIAIRGLANGRLHCKQLVLIGCAGLRGEYKGRKSALQVATKVGKVLSSPLPDRLRQRLRRGVYRRVGSDLLIAEHLEATFRRIVSDDVQSSAAKLHLPTLLIYGQNDSDTPVRYGRVLHNLIGGSRLEVVPGAGHFVHIDNPAQVWRTVEEFAA